MTLENFNYRTDPLFLRNQFDSTGSGSFKIPTIPKTCLTNDDFINLLLLGFDRANADDEKMTERTPTP